MPITLTISKTILAIADVEDKFQLLPCTASTFFREWQDNLPELTEIKYTAIDRLLVRFAAHRRRGILAEGAVDKLMITQPTPQGISSRFSRKPSSINALRIFALVG